VGLNFSSGETDFVVDDTIIIVLGRLQRGAIDKNKVYNFDNKLFCMMKEQ
jgi:hypothetical protein